MKRALLFLLLLTACTAPSTDVNHADLAEEAIRESPTHGPDGANLTLVSDDQDLVFTFISARAGYGERGEVKFPAQAVQHKAVVRIDGGKVVSIIIDEFWDELAQQPVRVQEQNEPTLSYAVTCIKPVPDPIIIYFNRSVHVMHFGEGCGKRPLNYSLDHSIFPPVLTVKVGEAEGDCPANCTTGISRIVIPVETVGKVVVDDGDIYESPFGYIACSEGGCPDGYFCAKPERGGICVLNSTESEEVLYERYMALQD